MRRLKRDFSRFKKSNTSMYVFGTLSLLVSVLLLTFTLLMPLHPESALNWVKVEKTEAEIEFVKRVRYKGKGTSEKVIITYKQVPYEYNGYNGQYKNVKETLSSESWNYIEIFCVPPEEIERKMGLISHRDRRIYGLKVDSKSIRTYVDIYKKSKRNLIFGFIWFFVLGLFLILVALIVSSKTSNQIKASP